MLVSMNTDDVVVFTDSQLVAQRVLGNFEVKEKRMFQYISKIKKEASQLLASSVNVVPEGWVTLLKVGLKSIDEEEALAVAEGSDWRGYHAIPTNERQPEKNHSIRSKVR